MTRASGVKPSILTRIAAWRRAGLLVLASALASTAALASGVPVDEASWADKNAAKKEYTAGTAAFERREFEAALARFRASYDIVASPNSHLMIARALMELGRPAEAYVELGGVIAEVEATAAHDKYAETARAAQALRQDLEAKLAFVTVQVPARVTVGEREVPVVAWGQPLPFAAGPAKVTVTPRVGEARTEELSLVGGARVDIDLQPPPPVPPPAPAPAVAPAVAEPPPVRGRGRQRAVAWVLGGIGVAGLGTFAVLTAVNDRAYRDLDADCEDDDCSRALTDAAAHDRALQAYGNASLGLGIAGLATGVLLYVTAPPAARATARRGPRLVPAPGGVALAGRFR